MTCDITYVTWEMRKVDNYYSNCNYDSTFRY